MDRISENVLTIMLRQTYYKGWCECELWQLYDFYGASRLSKNVWRDIKNRWDENVADDPDRPGLGIIRYSENASLLFVYLKPEFACNNTVRTIESMIK